MDINKKGTATEGQSTQAQEKNSETSLQKSTYSGKEVNVASESKDINSSLPADFSAVHDKSKKQIDERRIELIDEEKLISRFCNQLFYSIVNSETHQLDTSFLDRCKHGELEQLHLKCNTFFIELIKKELLILVEHIEYLSNNGVSSKKYPIWHEEPCGDLSWDDDLIKKLSLKKKLINDFPNILNKIFFGIRKSENAELKLISELVQHKAFRGFDTKHIWRLFIDEKDEDTKGKYGYENEPGYLAGCYRGFQLALELCKNKQKINSTLLTEIHDKSVKDVYIFPYRKFRMVEENGGMREDEYVEHCSICCTFTHGNLSDQGIDELISESDLISEMTYKHKKYFYEFKFYPHEQKKHICLYLNYTKLVCDDNVKSIIDGLLNTCYLEIENKTASDETKEFAIARCVTHLERIHPFHDGNCRTIGSILTNALRIYGGLKPIIWKNPNMLDGHSVEEIVKEQRKGCERFLAFCVKAT